ncbi:MAG TPA: SCO family protein [Kofleriaceae bacterium]
MRALAIALAVASLAAAPKPNTPEWADDADVVEHLGSKLPLDLPFRDSTGARVTLRDYFDGTQPVYLILAYYECPQLCSLVLDAANRAMAQLHRWGFDGYRALTISFDATEGTDQAARKKQMMGAGWPFLVGDAASIEALTQRLGFHFLRDAKTGAIAHAAVTFVIAPDGTISRYLYGIDMPPRDLRLALLESSDGKTGSIGDKILLRCFHYDAATHRYGLFVARFMQVGGALIFVVAVIVIASFARRRRR